MRVSVYRFQIAILAVCLLTTSCHRMIVVETQSSTSSIQFQKEDEQITKEINAYKQGLDSIMNEVVGYNESYMEKGQPESELGNFVCDLIWMGIDSLLPDSLSTYPMMVLMNNGGLRAPLPKGEVTVGDIFRLMPFDNSMVILKLNGLEMSCLLKFIVGKGGMPVSGLKMSIKDTIPSTILLEGKTFSEQGTYLVATSDYLANGGDNISCFPVQYYKPNLLVRDMIIQHYRVLLKRNQKVKPKKDHRIYYE